MVEFNTNIMKHLNRNQEGICILTSQNIGKVRRNSFQKEQMNQFNLQKYVPSPIQQVIDTMGELSSKAQGLKQVITTYDRLLSNTDNILYLQTSGGFVQGLLKIGYKKLFYRNNFCKILEIQPLCVLDFYVHETCQRTGIGKFMFEYMLKDKNVKPDQLAYDRPSPKLIQFLAKHYGLSKYIAQNNNFVIFDQYFENEVNSKTKQIETNLNQVSTSKLKPPIGKIQSKKNDEIDKLISNISDNLTQQKKQQKVRFDLHHETESEETKNQFSQTSQPKYKTQQIRSSSLQESKQNSAPWATYAYEILDQYQTSSNTYGKLKQNQSKAIQ